MVTYPSRRKPVQSQSKPTSTFRRKQLEQDYLKFCQLGARKDAAILSAAEFADLRSRANDYIPSHDFTERSAEAEILCGKLLDRCDPQDARRSPKVVNLPPHLSGLCEAPLLTAEQERQLFQRFNYLRFRAAQILDKYDAACFEPSNVAETQWDMERAAGLLRAADWHRDCIVEANLRLVISIVKKFVNHQSSFDDLLSDGIMALIRSVDKFDYKLGFRFSTYATQVVRRNSYKFVMDRQQERLKIANSVDEHGWDIAADDSESSLDEARWSELRAELKEYLDRLDKREKLIVRARFSLGGHRRVQTLQRLADRLGISKERVRQLEKRALEKLASMAKNSDNLAAPVSSTEFVYS